MVSFIMSDKLKTHKFAFMPDNWLAVAILTFSSWRTYDEVLFLTLKKNCDNITPARAFYIQRKAGGKRKKTWSFESIRKQ